MIQGFVCLFLLYKGRETCPFNYDGGFHTMSHMPNHCDGRRNFAIRKLSKICRIVPIKKCWFISVFYPCYQL